MNDIIFDRFLRTQFDEGMALSRDSDILSLAPGLAGIHATPVDNPVTSQADGPESRRAPDKYSAHFSCRSIVMVKGQIREANHIIALIRFPSDYLRRVGKSANIVAIKAPLNIYHPNIVGPFICLGRLYPGMGLCDILYQVFEILTFHKVSPADPLNPDAAAYARRHQDRFPTDRRPLRRARTEGNHPHAE